MSDFYLRNFKYKEKLPDSHLFSLKYWFQGPCVELILLASLSARLRVLFIILASSGNYEYHGRNVH
jgi:hypothetical protein